MDDKDIELRQNIDSRTKFYVNEGNYHLEQNKSSLLCEEEFERPKVFKEKTLEL